MISKFALVVLLALTQSAFGKPALFEARIEAKRDGQTIEITQILANRSRRNACFVYSDDHSFVLHYKNGTSSPGYVASEPEWRWGEPPPPAVQFVLNDGSSIRYSLFDIPHVTAISDVVSVDATVDLMDCGDLAAHWFPKTRTVFKAVLNAVVTD